MSFADFGVRSFVPEAAVGGFAEHLAHGRVMASRCRGCGRLAFPPRSGCPACGATGFDWVEIAEPGRLVTYAQVMYGPAGFEGEVPYTLAIAAFPMGIQVFGQMAADIPARDLFVDLPVRVVPRPLPGGRFSYQFMRA